MNAIDMETTVDAFIGGRVEAVQPKAGHHRAGLEAVLLAAALEPDFEGIVVDLGAGAGVAGMVVAARVPGARVMLVERDRETIAAARVSLARPANASFASRVKVVAADIVAPEAERVAAGLGRAFADVVITNPPFRDADAGTQSPRTAVRAAHVLDEGILDSWIRTAASVLKPDGRLGVIFRADGLGELMQHLEGRFGGIAILPVHPRSDVAARRVLVSATKGSRAPQRILPGLALHVAGGSAYLQPVERILRHGASLAEVHPSWAERGD